jgi:hypothetical protein
LRQGRAALAQPPARLVFDGSGEPGPWVSVAAFLGGVLALHRGVSIVSRWG